MKLTSPETRRAATLRVPDDGFEQLRVAFCERLKNERLPLLELGAALIQGDVNRRQLLDELRTRAHRLSGTAAIFELVGVAALARALEQANGALAPRAENSDRVMCAALHALANVIDGLDKPADILPLRGQKSPSRRAKAMLNG
jgi:HPt (histidine-containing phosphotransfer) domain-containing protein